MAAPATSTWYRCARLFKCVAKRPRKSTRIDPSDIDTEHYLFFTKSLEDILKAYGLTRKQQIAGTKKLVEDLVATEQQFFAALTRKKRLSHKVRMSFIDYITKERGNILSARPFYRDDRDVFTEKISPLIKARDGRALDFQLNAQFTLWALKRFGVEMPNRARALAEKSLKIRETIAIQNLPLAVSRANIFRSKTPASPHLARLDQIQICVEGLMSAIDKYRLPWTPTFVSTIIGRASGLMIQAYSTPELHLYSLDQTKLYRANKALRRQLPVEEIVQRVNSGLAPKDHTDAEEIEMLVNASHSALSLDAAMSNRDTEKASHISNVPAPGPTPEEMVESSELSGKLNAAVVKLSVLQRKILALRGEYLEDISG